VIAAIALPFVDGKCKQQTRDSIILSYSLVMTGCCAASCQYPAARHHHPAAEMHVVEKEKFLLVFS